MNIELTISRSYNGDETVLRKDLSSSLANSFICCTHVRRCESLLCASAMLLQEDAVQSVQYIPPTFHLWAPCCGQVRLDRAIASS